MKKPLFLVFAVGIVCGIGLFALFDAFAGPMGQVQVSDPREVGLPWTWLAFGFAAQGLFMGRMLVQWIASEKAKSSVVPEAFWWLSIFGGLMLLAYFLRRGDPVGVLGQLFGVVVYARNLIFIYRRGRA